MKRWTFILLCLEGAVLSFNVAASAALIPSIAKEFALSQFVVGKIVWLYMLPYGCAALLYGPLVRTFAAKRVECVCLVLFSLANILAGISANMQTLYLARFCMGLFGASVIPLALILIARHAPAAQKGKLVGAFFSATFVASLVGLGLSAILPWRMIYLIPGVLGLVLLAGMLKYFPDYHEEQSRLRFDYASALRNKKIAVIFAYIFFISLLYHGVQQWLGVYFSQKYGFDQCVISALITLTSLSGVFGEMLGGHLADSLGRLRTITLGGALMVVSIVLLTGKLPWWFLAVVLVVWGVGWTINHAGVSTMVTDLPREHLHESASLNSSVRFISGGLGAALAGVVMQRSFTAGLFLFAGMLLIVTIVSQNFFNRILCHSGCVGIGKRVSLRTPKG